MQPRYAYAASEIPTTPFDLCCLLCFAAIRHTAAACLSCSVRCCRTRRRFFAFALRQIADMLYVRDICWRSLPTYREIAMFRDDAPPCSMIFRRLHAMRRVCLMRHMFASRQRLMSAYATAPICLRVDVPRADFRVIGTSGVSLAICLPTMPHFSPRQAARPKKMRKSGMRAWAERTA